MSTIQERLAKMREDGIKQTKKSSAVTRVQSGQTTTIQDRLAKMREDGLKQTGKPASTAPAKEYDLSGEAWTRSTPSQAKLPSGYTSSQERELAQLRRQKQQAQVDLDADAMNEIDARMKSIRSDAGKQTFGDRASDTFSSMFSGSAASAVNTAGLAVNLFRDPDYNRRQIASLEKVLSTGRTTDGKTVTPGMRQQIQDSIDRMNAEISEWESQDSLTNRLYRVADRMQDESAAYQQSAKSGLGKVGGMVVDAATSMGQSTIDGLIGAATGTGMLPFVARAFGGATQEARRGGADLDQQMLYGSTEAAKEYISERIFGLTLPQKLIGKAGIGGLDGIVERSIRKAVSKIESDFGQKAVGGLLTWVASGVTEGLEEGAGDLIENILINPNFRSWDPDTRTTEEKFSDAFYDMLVGGLSGLMGGVTNLSYDNSEARAMRNSRLSASTSENSPVSSRGSVYDDSRVRQSADTSLPLDVSQATETPKSSVKATPSVLETVTPSAAVSAQIQKRNVQQVADFAQTTGKAMSRVMTSMYNQDQAPEDYTAGMMKAYSIGKSGGAQEAIAGIQGINDLQARSAYLAGQADAESAAAPVAETKEADYTVENSNGLASLSESLKSSGKVVQDGIRYTVKETESGYYTRIDQADGTGGYVENARANAYKSGPFATREEAVSDLLAVARSSFYPEESDWVDSIDWNAVGAELERRKATGQSPVDEMLRQAERIAEKQFGTNNVKEDIENGTEGVAEVSDEGTVREAGAGRQDAGRLLDGVPAEDVQADARGGDLGADASAESGGTGGLSRGAASERPAGVRGSGVHQGAGVQSADGGVSEFREFDADGNPVYATNREEAGVEAYDHLAMKQARADADKKYGIAPDESRSLAGYTQTTFSMMNRKMLDGTVDPVKDQPVVDRVLAALKKFPAFEGQTYRNLKFKTEEQYNDFLEKHAAGKTVTLKSFTSTSKRPNGYPLFGDRVVHMVISGKTGADISDTYGIPRQQEVILLPGTEIEIASVTTANDGHPLIYAQEVATHGVETDHGNARSAQGPAGNRRKDRSGRPGPGGDGGQSGAVRKSARDHDGRDGVLSERGESDPALTTEETSVPATTEEQIAEKADLGNQEQPKGQNYVIPAKGGAKLPTTPKARFKANTDAIKALRTIMAEGRLATPQEQEALAKYTGWGGITDAFDEKKADWAKEYKQLKNLLDDGEYKAARASILDAYYTDPAVIQGMYNGLAGIGFNGGRMLEPSAGVGRFIGAMPQEMAGGVQSWTAVELDKITGNIAKYLYPNADVRVQGFEATKIPDNYMDLVIGNVPFGNVAVADKAYPASVTKSIHNYFIAKSLDKLRPGGVACLITSSGTMDAVGADARGYFMKKADLIGAIRLPNTAFEGTGTGVVSDILVFKKREPGTAYKGESFLEVTRKPWEGPNMYGSYEINEYFANHPEMVLGTAAYGKGQYGRSVVTYNPLGTKASLQKQIEKAFGNIKVQMEYPAQRTQEEIRAEIKADAVKGKQGAIVSKNGKLYKNDGGKLVEASEYKGADIQRVADLVGIRDAARTLLDLQLDGGGEKAIAAARKKLNTLYDAFVKENGILNSPRNRKLLSGNVDAPFIRALENYDKDSGKATKAAIFTKNTVTAVRTVTHADTVEEALTVSMNETGGVDVNRIAQLTGRSADSVREDLLERGLVFKNRNGDLESAELYLSGNVRAKLRDAEALAEGDKSYERNIEALKKVIPADIPGEEIKVRIGATWVPDAVYSEFASEMLGGAGVSWKNGRRVPAIQVQYNRHVGKFFVEVNDSWLRNRPENTSNWGTKDYPFIGGRNSILESALNNKTVAVWRSVGETRVLDKQATAAAQEKMETVLAEFQRWLWSDETRKKDLSGLYNDVFNNTVTPKYDGSHLTVNGSNPDMEMRPHQKNAVQRIINSGGNTLLAHRVGAGKTYEMAAAAMKLRQLGIVKKPLIIAPKNLVAQWGNEFLSYFPAAKILVLESTDFTPTNRKLFANRIATGDYDAVIMSYEQFGAVPMSVENQEEFYQSQIDALEMAILESKRASGKDPSIRDMERSKKSFEAKLKKLGDSKKDVDNIDFEQLGVDALFVDEAHNFKNLFYTTKMQGIADLGNKEGSQRAFDLYMKVRYLQKLNGGRGIVFATATPVMNSVVELYTMQRYLQGDLLDAKGLTNFDAWANQFGDVVTIRKMKTGGNGYEIKQSLSKYKNLGEMQQMFRSFADVIVDAADLPYLKIPKMKTGKRIVVECDPSPFQEQFMEELGKRAEALRGAGKGGSEDHIFKVFNDGKKISYTQRMIDSSLPYEDGGKIMKCVENVSRIWNESKDIKGTQLIFCDQGTPGGAEATRGAALYADIKNLLVGAGIPENQIAFIHDATTGEAKSRLFKDVNDGKVRVLLGSTSTMGVGMNAQKRIVAMHELNAPDRPGDLEQNEGRGLRQGNMNDEVAVYAYVTKKTFDSRQWDNLKRKATFIHQVMSGEYNGREAAGDGDLALSAAEISAIASDNPLIMEQFEISEKINNLEMLERAHTKEVLDAKERIKKAEREIATDEITLKQLKADLASRQDTAGDKFQIIVGGKTYTERKAAGAAIIAAAKKHLNLNADTESSTEIGTFAGFKLLVTSKGDMLLRGAGQYRGTVNMEDATGTITRLQNVADRIETMMKATEARIAEDKSAIKKLEKTAAAPFAKAGELIAAKVRESEIMAELNPPSEQAVSAAEAEGDVENMVDDDIATDAAPHPERWQASRVGDPGKAPKPLSEIVEQIRHDFGLNITQGHIRGAGVRGQYDRQNNGIRARIANDLPTISHELGHALNVRWDVLGKRGSNLTDAMRKELEGGLSDEMKANYQPKQYLSEGYAEYIRKFLQNRETAAIDYPEFTKHFLNSLSTKDAAILEQLADEINAYYSLDADTATSSIRLREEGAPDARTWGEKIKAKASVLYQAWVDSNHGIWEFDKATGANTYKLATNAAYSDAIAGQIITGDLTDVNGQYVGPGLKAALHGLNMNDKQQYKLFGEYLTVKHGPERLAEGMRIFADDRKNSTAWMQNRQAQLEQQYPEFKEISERLYQFQADFLQTWGVDTGLVSQQSAEEWAKRWKFYVPFNRAVSEEKRGIGAKRGFANQNSTIKQARGSGLDIVHPVDNIINNLVKMVNAGVRNNVMRRITDEAEHLGADAAFLEKIPTPMVKREFDMTGVKTQLSDWIEGSTMNQTDKDQATGIISNLDDVLAQYGRGKAHGDVITVLKGGQQEFWKINDPLMLSSITNMSPKKMDGILDAYAVVSRFMTGNITGNNIIWSLFSNFPRDLGTFFTYSKVRNPVKVFASMGSAYVNQIKGDNADPLFKEYLAMGGGKTSAYTADRDLAKKARKSLSEKKIDVNPLDWITFVSDTVELGPRFATYKLMRQTGMNPQEAFYEACDITVNFRRSGDVSRQINKVVPFFNASVQGLDKFRRWITAADAPQADRAKTVRSRMIAYIAVSAALAAVFYGINNGDDDKEKDYQQLSNYTKNTYWNIPIGDGKYFAIPKPRELAVLSSFFETCMEYGLGGNEHAFDEFYEYATDNFLPSVASDIAQAPVNGLLESGMGAIGSLGIIGVVGYLGANRDFMGRPIVSSGLQNLEPKDQYTERTSKIAYWVGQAFNVSPQRVDYFFNSTLGGWWKAQKALFPVGKENVDLTLGVQNTYIKDNQYSTDLVNWLYDKADASNRAKNSDQEDMEKAIEYKMDSNMTTFYSRYYKLAKSAAETTSTRATRQIVLDMILEYRKSADTGASTKAQDAVCAVCDKEGSTEFLPSVMQSTIKDGDGTQHTLSDVQYVEYQTDYLRIYWENVEQNLPDSKTDVEKAAILKAAKEVAKEEATNRTLKRIGAKATSFQEKYKNVGTNDVIQFRAQLDLADDDGSLKQDEVIGILQAMIQDGLSYDEAYLLFHSRYDSDKNNPWWRYKP